MNKIRILLADDHSIMRVGLASLLSREKDMLVVGEAEELKDCLLEILHCQDLLTRVYDTKIVYSPED